MQYLVEMEPHLPRSEPRSLRMGMGHQSQSVHNESWIWTIDPGPIDEWVEYGLIHTQLHRLGFHGYIKCLWLIVSHSS